jgi:MATE family multidrug resistance protein
MALSTETITTAGRKPLPGGIREISDLAYPVVLTQISTTLMGVVDSAMVGRLGATELAAVGFAGVWIFTLYSLLDGTASGVQTFVSQAEGADDSRSCGSWVWQALYALAPAAILMTLGVALFVRPALALLGPSDGMQTAAASYVLARAPGEVGFVLVMIFTSFFRGVGDTRTPLYVTLGANIVNLVLDYGLIFGNLGLPAWGVAGAGTATAIAHWVSMAAIFLAYRRKKLADRYQTHPVRPDKAAIRRFLRTGVPIGGQWFMGMTSFAVFTTMVAHMGDTPMAASQAFVMLLSLSFMQAVGIAIAATTLVGRYVGAENPEAVARSFRSAIVLGIGVGGLVALLFVTIPTPLLRIFTDEADVLSLGRPLLLIGALFQLFDAVAIISDGALRGAGDTRWPFLVELALGWGFFLPLAWFLAITLDGGLTGAWLGGLIHICLLALVLVLRFRSGAWKRIRI